MFFLQRLTDAHDLTRFRSTEPSLDKWLRDAAVTAARADTARTWVMVDDAGEVVGYFAVAPHVLLRDDMPNKIRRPGPEHIPAMLLAKLARADHLNGAGAGSLLLVESIRVCLQAMRNVGGRYIAVEALNEPAAKFYEHFGFTRIPNNTERLFLRSSDAAASIGVEWP